MRTDQWDTKMTRPLRLLLRLVLLLLLLLALAAIAGWWAMRGSLAQLDGELSLPGLTAPVSIERDALGVVTIHAASETDAARALGLTYLYLKQPERAKLLFEEMQSKNDVSY